MLDNKILLVVVLATFPISSPAVENVQWTPSSWKEHWNEKHSGTLSRVKFDDHLALYLENDSEQITWPFSPLSNAWEYVKETYGPLGPDPHLYLILHKYTKAFCLTGSYLQSGYDNRNVIDCAQAESKHWDQNNPENLESLLANLVEVLHKGAKGIKNDADLALCEDNMWEIIMYDIYVYLKGETDEDVLRWKKEKLNEVESGIYWFRDWFLPIYKKYGGAAVLNNFYNYTKLYWKRAGVNGNRYASMNLGEFVHFWSGAAGKDLHVLAQKAFKWSEENEAELERAREDYTSVSVSYLGGENVVATFFGATLLIASFAFVACGIKRAVEQVKLKKVRQHIKSLNSDDDDDDEELIKLI